MGYHYFIRRDGTVEKGRPDNMQGAQVLHHNENNLGICMTGGLREGTEEPEDNYTAEQYASLIELLTKLRETHQDAQIMGHNGFSGHESRGCPCFDWKALRGYLERAWTAPYKPLNWHRHNWKKGIPASWETLNWYDAVVKQV